MLKCGNAPCRLWDSGAEHYCTSWRGQLSNDCGFFEYIDPNEGPMPDREFTEIVTIGGECLSETTSATCLDDTLEVRPEVTPDDLAP